MKSRMSFSKKDLIVSFVCVVFILVSLGSVGGTGRRRAKEALCLSNLGRWGEIFLDYAADNDGYFMRGWWAGWTERPKHTDYWMEALRPYYVNPDLRCCPEAAIPGTQLGRHAYGGSGPFVAWGAFPGECGEPSPWPYVVGCDYGSYGMNAWACNPPSASQNNWRTADVTGGRDIPLLTGAQWIEAWPEATDEPPLWDGETYGPFNYRHMVRVCMNRHSGFVNSAFLDGSARKVGLKELWTLKWHREYDTCGGWTQCGGVEPNDWAVWMRDFEDY